MVGRTFLWSVHVATKEEKNVYKNDSVFNLGTYKSLRLKENNITLHVLMYTDCISAF